METQQAVKERPILFSGAMVKAILNGSKTQTRRAFKYQFDFDPTGRWTSVMSSTDRKKVGNIEYSKLDPEGLSFTDRGRETVLFSGKCPYGKPGDRLYVRETWCQWPGGDYWYAADERGQGGPVTLRLKWKPSIHMPRVASRILLEIVSVRVERLESMGESDAIAEGLKVCPNMNGREGSTGYVFPDCDYDKAGLCHSSAVTAFWQGWDSIYGADEAQCWASNPWVWVVEFRRINP